MTTAQRLAIAPPVAGLLIFDTSTKSYWYCNFIYTLGGTTYGNWSEIPNKPLWELNGLGGNEITNTNTGGFWSKNATLIDYNSPTNVNPPISGAGTRLMWVSGKAAFRAGTTSSTDWDNINMGVCSFATGYNVKASAFGATAMGSSVSATGSSALAIGNSCSASGTSSIALGFNSFSNGDYSTAIDGGGITDKAFSHSLAIGPGSIVGKKNQMVTTFDEYRFRTYSSELLITNNEVTMNRILYLNGSQTKILGQFGYLSQSGTTGFTTDYNSGYDISLRANDRIVARDYAAFSDARHKKLLNYSKGSSDLALLNQLKVSHYTFIDTVAKGKEIQLGFIAQEVEKIVPNAVKKLQDYIPSVYDMAERIVVYNANAHTLTVTTKKPHDFQAKDEIRLISLDKEHKVYADKIIDAHTFVVNNWEKAVDKIFVFGKQVNDFRTVDYDRLFTLGISSIQELSRKIDALEQENLLLKAKNQEFNLLKKDVAELKAMLLK